MNEVLTKCFSIYIIQFEAHEVSGVERIVFPHVPVFSAIQKSLDLIGTAFHNPEFFYLLRFKIWRFQCLQDERLGWMGTAGNSCANDTQRLLLQSGQYVCALGCICDKAYAEAPYIFLFGCSIDLNWQNARMQAG
ncbi:hypothetical protein D3C81_1601690 [compost metagenome]